ncbi:AraC family transcriptional regulator [Scytonema sp. UIC 10036]|uniref:AraC family transcriptional regulator n=1 Tax=Scytonema sp. UIC 10036 TaxID=2304196 RepID=UPI00140F5925|nr:AraC family transcriptional regulator [Scytonema sp. UIC 10036]
MSESQIHLIDTVTEKPFSAAPQGCVRRSSAEVGWRGIVVEMHSIPPMELPEHYVQGHRLIVHAGQPIEYEWKDNSHWRSKLLHPGEFCLQSHGEVNFPRWHDRFEFIAIALDPTFVDRSFQDSGIKEGTCFQEQRAAFDPVIADFAQRFQAELISRSYGGVLYGESLALAFALYLLQQHSVCPKSFSQPRGKLSSLQLREIIEYIHANLSEELSLTHLAELLNLSVFHFARLFKNSLGLSPHQYVLQNRVERAKKLITVCVDTNLTDIALQVGFYDQTHFGKAFKRTVGVSPKVFAKLRAS